MREAPGVLHQSLLSNLMFAFKWALKEQNCNDCEVLLPINLRVSDETVLQPDLSLICRPDRTAVCVEQVPELVLDILSPATRKKDLNLKSEVYAEFGIRYYVIIDPEPQMVELYEVVEGRYQLIRKEQAPVFTFELAACQPLTIDFGTGWTH